MRVSILNNTLSVELDAGQAIAMKKIHETWPNLIQEYLEMIIKNRSRQLERIEVTQELQSRKLNREKL